MGLVLRVRGARDGGQVAAPVFREIAEGILPEMGVAQDTNQKPVFDAPERSAEEVPDTVAEIKEEPETGRPASEGKAIAKSARPEAKKTERSSGPPGKMTGGQPATNKSSSKGSKDKT